MEFVVQLLRDVFQKSQEESIGIMLDVHNRGAGICGVYTRDVAETKAEIVVTIARKNEYPLQCLVEKE
jgi:ATP-dependent Clp protease adaptor protein ClpS